MQAANSSLCTQQIQQQQQLAGLPLAAFPPHPSPSPVLQAIEELPGQESPEIFGLHPNADLTFRTLQVQAAVQIIMDTRPKGGGSGGGLSREEVVDRICEDLLSKVAAASVWQTTSVDFWGPCVDGGLWAYANDDYGRDPEAAPASFFTETSHMRSCQRSAA